MQRSSWWTRPARAGTLDLLVFNVAHVADRAMLGAEGYGVAKVLRVLDSWMDEAVHGVQCPPGGQHDPRRARHGGSQGGPHRGRLCNGAGDARAGYLDHGPHSGPVGPGPGTEGMDFAAAVAGVGAALAIGLTDGNRDRALSEADEALASALARQAPRVRAA